MPKKTLLEIVQDILSDMSSDEVNSIDDTVESLQVANIVRSTFEELTSNRVWPTHAKLIQLTSSADSSNPTKLILPDNIDKIEFVKYDVRESVNEKLKYQTITYKSPKEFLDIVLSRDSTDTNIQTVTIEENVTLLIDKSKAPSYWTSFNDKFIYFDSYDSDIDTTIQSSKTICMAIVEPDFQLVDTFVPEIPAKAFPYFIAECKSNCFEKIKQAPSQKEEQKSRRQRVWLAKEKWKTNGGIKVPNYGRK